MEDLENPIVIEEAVEVVEEEFDTEGLAPEEIEMAKEQGLIKEVKEEKEETKEADDAEGDRLPEGDKEEEAEEDEEVLDPKSFEEMEEVFDKSEDKFHKKFTSNAKALYFQNKKNKNLRQDLQRQNDEYKSSQELDSLKGNVSAKKLDKITEMLKNGDNLTIEAIQDVIGNVQKDTDGTDMVSRADLEAEQKQKLEQQQESDRRMASRFQLAESIGRSKYDDFDAITNLAQEVINEDTTGVYQKAIGELFGNINVDEDDMVKAVVKIAEISPKFKDLVKKASPEDKEKVGRAIQNSKKKVSSAAMAGSGKRTITNEDDLTLDDGDKMTKKQWGKLKESTRQRLLRESSQ